MSAYKANSLPRRFDTRFVGFGWNKVSFVEGLAGSGAEFYVLSDVFMVHTPHAPSPSLAAWRDSELYKRCIGQMYKEWSESRPTVDLATKSPPGVQDDPVEQAKKRRSDRLKKKVDTGVE